MSEQPRIWNCAFENHWNISSVSRDFKHILIYFNKRFSDWISPLSDEQKVAAQGLYQHNDDSCCALDGSMFRRYKRKYLENGIRRSDYYDHKRKYPEALNVQCVATKSNVVTHLLTGLYLNTILY